MVFFYFFCVLGYLEIVFEGLCWIMDCGYLKIYDI